MREEGTGGVTRGMDRRREERLLSRGRAAY